MKKKAIQNMVMGWCGAVIAMALMAAAGCTGGFARFERDAGLTRILTEYQVLPEYRYYTVGPFNEPEAILGVQRDYELDSTLWREVSLTPSLLQRWLGNIEGRVLGGSAYYGSYIIDSTGNRLGIWYSAVPWTTVRPGDGNRLQVYPPFPPDTRQYLYNRERSLPKPPE